jgi:hypothetical protein
MYAAITEELAARIWLPSADPWSLGSLRLRGVPQNDHDRQVNAPKIFTGVLREPLDPGLVPLFPSRAETSPRPLLAVHGLQLG